MGLGYAESYGGFRHFGHGKEVWAVSLDILDGDGEAREGGREVSISDPFLCTVQCKHFHILSIISTLSILCVFHRFTSRFQPYSFYFESL